MIHSDGYSISDYGTMISGEIRTKPFVEALRRAVTPDSVVLEIGTGTGFFAMLACQFGARKVYAIEPDTSIELGKLAAKANGCADRIEWFSCTSTEIDVPERANLMISDLRGTMPLYRAHIPSVMDARKRLLTPDATLLPRRDKLRIVPVGGEALYRKSIVEPWQDNSYGLDLRSALPFLTNTWWREVTPGDDLLAEPATWCELDYATISSPNISGSAAWTVASASTMRGFCMWFDMDIAEGCGFSNGPGGPDLVYGHGFVPLSQPVELAAGDRVDVEIKANLVAGDYIYRWKTTVTGKNGQAKASFDQSTFKSRPRDMQALRKSSADFVPTLNPDGRIDHEILEAMDGGISLQVIANGLCERHPDRFADRTAAFDRVASLSSKYAADAS